MLVLEKIFLEGSNHRLVILLIFMLCLKKFNHFTFKNFLESFGNRILFQILWTNYRFFIFLRFRSLAMTQQYHSHIQKHFIYTSSCQYKITSNWPELVAIVFTTTGSNANYYTSMKSANHAWEMTHCKWKNDSMINVRPSEQFPHTGNTEWPTQEMKEIKKQY